MVPNVLVTFPGKIGDALMQWPCAYFYWKETGNKFTVLLDQSISCLKNLFTFQECVKEVLILDRMENWRCGGQPYDFALTKEEKSKWDNIYHMGFRQLPEKQLTLQAAENIPIKSDREEFSKQSIFVGDRKLKSALIVHGSAGTHHGIHAKPRVWDVFGVCEGFFRKAFDEIIFVGNKEDSDTKDTLGYEGTFLDDGGDLLPTAAIMNGAEFVLGAGSCMVALAGTLGIPSLRIHDPLWGAEDYRLWGFLGKQHGNYYPKGAILKNEVLKFVEEQCRSRWGAKLTVSS